jgi:hypothetical protein
MREGWVHIEALELDALELSAAHLRQALPCRLRHVAPPAEIRTRGRVPRLSTRLQLQKHQPSYIII